MRLTLRDGIRTDRSEREGRRGGERESRVAARLRTLSEYYGSTAKVDELDVPLWVKSHVRSLLVHSAARVAVGAGLGGVAAFVVRVVAIA